MTQRDSVLAFSLYLVGFPFGLLCGGIWKIADAIDGPDRRENV